VEELLVQEIERPVVGVTDSSACFDDLVQTGCSPGRTGGGAEDATDRALLLTEILELARSVLVAARSGWPWGAAWAAVTVEPG
jgi:hypothetical protein